jgi:hypothetical protein
VDLAERTEVEIAITGADFPLVAFDSVWVVAADRPEPAIVRVDPASNEVVAEIVVPGRGCNGATASPDAIWACSSDGVARIDPATNTVTTVVDVDAFGQARLAYGAGSVWAFTRAGDAQTANAVVRIDPTTAAVTATIPLDHPLGTMAFGFDALWVTSPDDGLLLRVDPATGEGSVVRDDLTGAFTVVVGPDSVWVSLFGTADAAPGAGDPTIARIDPTSGDVVATIVTEPIGNVGGIAADETAVWIRGPTTFLTQIDPATNQVVERITAKLQTGGDVVLGFDSVWAASFDFGRLWRVAPE